MAPQVTAYVLAAGEKTPWMDLRPDNGGAFTLQGLNDTASVASVEICNADPSSSTDDTPDDVGEAESHADAFFVRTFYGPLPRFMRVKNTSATGTVTVTFGQGYDAKGNSGLIAPVGFQFGTSGRSNEMPS